MMKVAGGVRGIRLVYRFYSTNPIVNPNITRTTKLKKEVKTDVNKDLESRIERINESIIKVPPPRELKKYLDNYIIGQNTGKKVMSVAVFNHYLRINDKAKKLSKKLELEKLKKEDEIYKLVEDESKSTDQIGFNIEDLEDEDLELSKSNILILGPSGSGKTLIAKTLAKILNVPFSITDCTQLTQAGYIGEDVELCIQRLLINSNYDVEKTEKGIIVLDEVDKLAKPAVATGTKDVSGEGVQQALLKLIEGTTVQVQVKKPVNKEKDPNGNNAITKKTETFLVDTSNILFVLMGAFVGLDGHIVKRLKEVGIEEVPNDKKQSIKQIKFEDGNIKSSLELVTPQDLTSYGMIPELIGRVPIITGLDSLNEDNLLSILREPKNALLNQYTYIFEQFGVKLLITEPALINISELALKEGTGARGLRGIMERLLLTVNYECPDSGVSYVLINKETVESINSGNIKAFYFNDKEELIKEIQKEDKSLLLKI